MTDIYTELENKWFNIIHIGLKKKHLVILQDELLGENRPLINKFHYSYKIISGPRLIGENNNYIENDETIVSSIQQYTLNIKSFFKESIDDLVNFQQYLFIDPDNLLIKNNIAIVDRGTIIDVSYSTNTGVKKQYSLDIIFNTIKEYIIKSTTIHTTDISATQGRL